MVATDPRGAEIIATDKLKELSNNAPEDVEKFIGGSNNRDATLGNNANTLLAFV